VAAVLSEVASAPGLAAAVAAVSRSVCLQWGEVVRFTRAQLLALVFWVSCNVRVTGRGRRMKNAPEGDITDARDRPSSVAAAAVPTKTWERVA
jgi:hypothetical protein